MCNSRAHCPTNPRSVEKNIFYLHSKYDNVGKDIMKQYDKMKGRRGEVESRELTIQTLPISR